MRADAYRAIFFDADDTLFDYPRAERTALAACRDAFGIDVPPQALLDAYRRHNADLWREFERGQTDQGRLRVERFRRVAAELGLAGLPLERISAFYLDALSRQHALLPGALGAVRALARVFPLALITNGIAAVQRRRLAASPVTPYFRAIVISEEAGVAKPDPAIFAPALRAIGVAAGEVLYVGDSVSSDMAAARNAGMDFCWLERRGAAAPDGYAPALIVSSVRELPGRLGL